MRPLSPSIFKAGSPLQCRPGSATTVKLSHSHPKDLVGKTQKCTSALPGYAPPLVQPPCQWTKILNLLALALLLRALVSISGYSGYQKPPRHGDFEAQRHWMEITTKLPATSWYFDDQDWWPLDYPPLTAYHSWALGKIGTLIEPRWFALIASRGSEEPGLKIFMRCTVILSEILFLTPAILLVARQLRRLCAVHETMWELNGPLAALLLQPALILIDHGHFQYNVVMLGCFMATIASLLADRRLLGCVFFVAALTFKQMALFYAPVIGAYLAGTCLTPRFCPLRLLAIVGVTILSLIIVYLPLLISVGANTTRGHTMSSIEDLEPLLQKLLAPVHPAMYPFAAQIVQTLDRVFPFSRGLFEDKVANIWCSIHFSGLYKLNSSFQPKTLGKLSLGLTALSILPPSLIILFRPRKGLLLLASTTSAWGFFLCGYQVHEKNVLLPLLPMTALLAGSRAMESSTRAWVGFANVVATWTLYHLLIKDELQLVYLPVVGIWTYLMKFPPFSFELYRPFSDPDTLRPWTRYVHFSAFGGIALWHVLERLVPPPSGKPDLWIVINMMCGCGAFCLCYGWCLWSLTKESGLLQEWKSLRCSGRLADCVEAKNKE